LDEEQNETHMPGVLEEYWRATFDEIEKDAPIWKCPSITTEYNISYFDYRLPDHQVMARRVQVMEK
jgi:hypothetical protein